MYHRFFGCVCVLLLLMVVGLPSVFAGEPIIREQATVVSKTVNIREGCSTDTPVLTMAHAGEEFRVIVKTEDWIKINHPQFGAGWIYRPLVALSADTIMPQQPEQAVTATSSTGKSPNGTLLSGHLVPIGIILGLVVAMIVAVYLVSRGNQYQLSHRHR